MNYTPQDVEIITIVTPRHSCLQSIEAIDSTHFGVGTVVKCCGKFWRKWENGWLPHQPQQAAAPSAEPPAKAAAGKTFVIALIDASGSMLPFRTETISAFNSYLDDLAADGKEYEVTVAVFSDRQFYRVIGVDTPSSIRLRLNENNYVTKGFTALFDATGQTISNFLDTHTLEAGQKVIMVTTTDGEENNSVEWTAASLKDLITNLEATGNWTFQYLSMGLDGWAQASQMGYGRGSTVSTVSTSPESIASAYHVAGRATRSYAGGMSVNTGQTHDWMEEELGPEQVIPNGN